jgi:GNAT superfamily N-acetyltransferase
MDAAGRVETVAYDALTLYERWTHGGPWMSIETGVITLNTLLVGAGLPLVASDKGLIVGYAEVYPGSEPEPFGTHLHITHLVIKADYADRAVADALIKAVFARARELRAVRVTISRAGADALALRSYPVQIARLVGMRRVSMTARQGQLFYKATDYPDPEVRRVSGWAMPIGRATSARCEWETVMARTYDSIPELRARVVHRLHISASGQEALIHVGQQPYDPRSAALALWTPKGLAPQMMTAVRDWAHRQGYRALNFLVQETLISTLGAEPEDTGYRQEVCTLAPAED